jgi:hypothetical protein
VASAKDLIVKPISARDAIALVRRIHYSGKVATNSQLHLGVFLDGRLEGAMQFGPSMDKRKMQGLVAGTGWNGFLELNRMAFSDRLPRNSESRALAVAFRMIRKHYPHVEWIVSFSDAAQCGDGTIYRASGFVLTSIKKNVQMLRMPDGSVMARKTLDNGNHTGAGGKFGSAIARENGAVPLPGYQLRYVYFLHPTARERLTVPILPFSEIESMGAGMYRGEKITRTKEQDAGHPSALDGAIPIRALQTEPVSAI